MTDRPTLSVGFDTDRAIVRPLGHAESDPVPRTHRRLEQWQESDSNWGVRLWSSWVWRYLAPVCALFAMFFVLQDIGPAWSARHPHAGSPGLVTVTKKHCRHGVGAARFEQHCSFDGDFISDDGAIRLNGVTLASGFDGPEIGATLPARDVGDRTNVYPIGGGNDWIYTSLAFLASVAVLALWCSTVLPRISRRFDAARRQRS